MALNPNTVTIAFLIALTCSLCLMRTKSRGKSCLHVEKGEIFLMSKISSYLLERHQRVNCSYYMQQNKDEKKFVSHRDLSVFIWNKQFVVMYCCLYR